jgi:parallel beta-helix repeat protein
MQTKINPHFSALQSGPTAVSGASHQKQICVLILASLAMVSAPALADILVVNPADPAAFAQIQAAVDAALPGDTIVVHSGTYGAVQVATDGITIKAAPSASPLIDADEGQYGVLIQASGVTLRGLQAYNAFYEDTSPAPPWFDGSAFMIMGHNNTIVDCTAFESDFGFSVNPADLEGTRSTGNVLRNNTARMTFGGFYAQRADGGSWVNNFSTDNSVGFMTANSNSNRFVNNRAEDNYGNGFWITAYLADFIGSNDNEFVGNKAINNGFNGIRVALSMNNRFNASEATGNGHSAPPGNANGISFVAWSAGNEVIGGQFRGNAEYGVHAWPDSEDNFFRGLSFRNNGLGNSNFPLR